MMRCDRFTAALIMTSPDRDDPVWQAAWHWVQREHEGPWQPQDRAALTEWLAQGQDHRQAYDDARQLWLLAGLMPPAGDAPPVDG